MNTVAISIYQFTTFSSAAHAGRQHKTTPTSEKLHDQINTLMRDKKSELERRGVDTTVFYNHHPETGKTLMRYPLVIYHCIGNRYYLTGINHGAYALDQLAALYPGTFPIGQNTLGQFMQQTPTAQAPIGITAAPCTYKLVEWRPMHHRDLKAYNKQPLTAKVASLNQRLHNHIANQLGKYLEIELDGLQVEIIDIEKIYPMALFKGEHPYPAYDICFTANLALPGMITLGNHQSLGYGRVEPA